MKCFLLYRFTANTLQIQEINHTNNMGINNLLHATIKPNTIIMIPPMDDAYSNPTGPKNTVNNNAPARLFKGNFLG